MNQAGVVRIFDTANGGQISVAGGLTAMDSGLEGAAYLSLFGGNADDNGQPGNATQWWGNFSETDPARQYRSYTQNIIDSLPATSGNLRRLEDAIANDLAWMVPAVASEVTASAQLTAPKRVEIAVAILAEGVRENFKFAINWEAQA
jgi:hypothetical protein